MFGPSKDGAVKFRVHLPEEIIDDIAISQQW
jgi:hypothetical protein